MDDPDRNPAGGSNATSLTTAISGGETSTSRREAIKSVTAIFSDVAVILGLLFAAVQTLQIREHERVRIAVDATAAVHSPPFLAAYTNIIDAQFRGKDIPRDDLVFVANVYDSIAVLYLRGVADEAIIQNRIGSGIPRIIAALKLQHWNEASTGNLERMVRELRIPEQTPDR